MIRNITRSYCITTATVLPSKIESALTLFVKEYSGTKGKEEFGDTLLVCSYEPGSCAMVSEELVKFFRKQGITSRTITGLSAKNKAWLANAGVSAGSEDDAHTCVLVGSTVIDLTFGQFVPTAKIVTLSTLDEFKRQWTTTE